jgi:hypothetical protein
MHQSQHLQSVRNRQKQCLVLRAVGFQSRRKCTLENCARAPDVRCHMREISLSCCRERQIIPGAWRTHRGAHHRRGNCAARGVCVPVRPSSRHLMVRADPARCAVFARQSRLEFVAGGVGASAGHRYGGGICCSYLRHGALPRAPGERAEEALRPAFSPCLLTT